MPQQRVCNTWELFTDWLSLARLLWPQIQIPTANIIMYSYCTIIRIYAI